MTGPLLSGPALAAPTGAPAQTARAAQPLRSGAQDFAGSLRGATQRREAPAPETREPEAEPAPGEPEPVDRAEAPPEADDGAPAPDGLPESDEPVLDDAPEADAEDVVAAPVAASTQRVSTDGPVEAGPAPAEGDAEANAGPAGARRVSRGSAAQGGGVPTGADADGDAQSEAAIRSATIGAQGRVERPAAQQSGANMQTLGAGAAGELAQNADAEGAGAQRDGQQGHPRDGSRSAGLASSQDAAGAFAQRAEDAGSRPGADTRLADEPAPARSQPTAPSQSVAEPVRPQSLRLEQVATPASSAGAAGRGAEAADDSAAMQAVHRGLGAAVRQRGGSVTIRLSPESMGQVRIEMSIRQGTVDVRFEASTEQARELLTRHADMLRSTLHQKGFGVERIDVHTQPAPTNGSRAGADASGDQQHRRSPEQDAAGGESRGAFGGRDDGRRDGAWREDDEAQTFEQWRVRVNATA
ncbi:MAG: flagellar hook-length control protein FliK [Phycisphaerales bacterium]